MTVQLSKKQATEIAVKMAFASTGAFGDNIDGLLQSIRNIADMERSHGYRAMKAAMEPLFNGPGCIELSNLFAMVRTEEIPAEFETLVACCLGETPCVDDNQIAEEAIYLGAIKEDCFDSGTPHQLSVSVDRLGSLKVSFVGMKDDYRQCYVDETQRVEMTIEVNQGVPSVHVYSGSQGESLVSLFVAKDGLVVDSDYAVSYRKPVTGSNVSALYEECERGKSEKDGALAHIYTQP